MCTLARPPVRPDRSAWICGENRRFIVAWHSPRLGIAVGVEVEVGPNSDLTGPDLLGIWDVGSWSQRRFYLSGPVQRRVQSGGRRSRKTQKTEKTEKGSSIVARVALPRSCGDLFLDLVLVVVLALVLVLVLKRFWRVHYNVVAFIVGPAGDDKSHVHCSAPPCLPDRADRALSCSQHVPLASFTRCFLSSQPHRIVVNMHCENI